MAQLGQQVPDLAFRSLDGGTVRLSDFRGKKLLIFVWGSW